MCGTYTWRARLTAVSMYGWSLLASMASGRDHYYQIPKTGSLTDIAILRTMGCAAIKVHDHTTGCPDLQMCNGTAEMETERGELSFVAVREVCDRFSSQQAHLHRFWPQQFGDNTALATAQELLSWLWSITDGCPSGQAGVACKVLQINKHLHSNHRVILYPQAFFMGPSTQAICFERERPAENFMHYLDTLRGGTRCWLRPTSNVSESDRERVRASIIKRQGNHATYPHSPLEAGLCSSVKEFYDQDHLFWDTYCPLGIPRTFKG